MNKKLLEEAQSLAARNYEVLLSEDTLSTGQPMYLAENPELLGCIAQGNTPEEAINNLYDARVDYIYDSLKNGAPIRDPKIIPVKNVTTQFFTFDGRENLLTNETAEKTYQPATINQSFKVRTKVIA